MCYLRLRDLKLNTPQNALYTPGITTRPSPSGQDFASSQYSPMRSKRSRRLLWYIRSSRRATRWYVMIHYDLDHAKVFIGRRSKRHKVKQGGLKHARERLVMMVAEVPLFSHSGSHTHNLRRVWSSYPRICAIPISKASIPPTQARIPWLI